MDLPGSLREIRRLVLSVGGGGVSAKTALLVGGVALAAAGCSEFEVGPTDSGLAARVDVAFEVPGGEPSSSVSTSVTVSESDPSLVVDSVDVAIRELQIGREGTECGFGGVGSAGDGGDGTDCEEVFIQTILQTLPVDDGSEVLLPDGLVEPGTIDRFAFRVNVLEGEAGEELEILNDRGDMQDASFFIGGTYEGERFELRLDPDEEVVVEADAPLTLESDEEGRAALVWDVAEWFVDPDDGGIEDPNQVAEDAELEQQVEDRIFATMEARFTQ